MLKKDLSLRNPLSLLGNQTDDIIPAGKCGAILARAGVGKTAMIVQIALHSLLRGKNVLHISLNEPVDKVTLWYREVFNLLADEYNVTRMDQLWESLFPHRFIMTFKVGGFSVPKLQERLSDIVEQQIFVPTMMIIDGLPFDDSAVSQLRELTGLAQKHNIHIWLTVTTHRHEAPGPDGLPVQMTGVSDFFEFIVQLRPEGDQIHIDALKGGPSKDAHTLLLDPSTMLVKDIG
ncbi:MAG: cytoplasmic protein [Desulfobacteraceae bacterium]|nr:cytoplasmic protein [Desulfobacteraceae bacterium]